MDKESINGLLGPENRLVCTRFEMMLFGALDGTEVDDDGMRPAKVCPGC